MTIYALSTGPGISGIAIVRVSGEDAKKVIKLLELINFTILLLNCFGIGVEKR